MQNNPSSPSAETLIFEYKKPKYHISCSEFYEYCEKEKLINLN